MGLNGHVISGRCIGQWSETRSTWVVSDRGKHLETLTGAVAGVVCSNTGAVVKRVERDSSVCLEHCYRRGEVGEMSGPLQSDCFYKPLFLRSKW